MPDISLSARHESRLKQKLQHLFWRLIAVLPDRPYLRWKYYSMAGRFPDLERPRLFSEKVQARKLYDRRPIYAQMVDKHGAKALARQLNRSGVPAVELHGNLSQGQRTRSMDAFHSGRATTLVATDIAARGIHVDDVALVVHADPPAEHKAYLHRSGRTARAGRDGWAITLVEYNQHTQMRILQRGLRLPLVPAIEVFSNNPNLRDLTRFEADLAS